METLDYDKAKPILVISLTAIFMVVVGVSISDCQNEAQARAQYLECLDKHSEDKCDKVAP